MWADRSIFHVRRAAHICLLLSVVSALNHGLDMADCVLEEIA